jgi:chromosomal replication initiator protein
LVTQDTAEILQQILDRAKTLDPVNARQWFDDLTVLDFDGGTLQIGCPDEAKAQFLQDNYRQRFTQIAQNITGHLVSISFGVINPAAQPEQRTQNNIKLHPDYTFDSFVTGPSNRLAHASSIAVSHSPGNTYNPLFLYGSVGLGKTHMLHAICHDAIAKNPDISIQFLSCEEFVNGFISAIEKGRLSDFQNQYRTVDVLIIDDIQFLRERERSQEEFFHTFNTLYNNRKQIVLTADCAPGDLPSLEERLVSRFKWGLVARLDPPSYETRIAILQKKAHIRGLAISDDIIQYIARKVKANIRELEGALTILYASAQTLEEPITLELARHALGDHSIIHERRVSITEIINAVTDYYDVRLTDLQSKKRAQSIALPRQICMYLARSLTSHSLEEIGGHLGGRDHTTVLHACGKIKDLEISDPSTKSELEELTATIKTA